MLFGSNMGDKEGIFAQSCLLINNRCGTITAMSKPYESEPWGFEADEWFLNRVVAVATELSPEVLMEQLLDIEAELGRVRHPEIEGYTSRTVDLDVLYYGNRVMATKRLTVPHPRLHLRRFALVPLCDLIPDFIHPVLGLSQQELLAQCPDQGIVRELNEENTNP